MKLISLNTWGGRVYKPLIDFIKKESKDTDIFCLQEVFKTPTHHKEYKGYRVNLFDEIAAILEDFDVNFAPSQDNQIFLADNPEQVNFELSWGLAIFIRKNLTVKSSGDFFVFGERNSLEEGNLYTLPRNIQYVNFETAQGKKFIVCNIHGVWTPGPKKDTPSRIEQSRKILEFISNKNGVKIICGDFNLDINTKSLKMLEGSLRNLIKDFNIQRTRSRLSPFFEKPNFHKFADYTFVSDEVKIKSFEMPDVEISDHLPMILEFE